MGDDKKKELILDEKAQQLFDQLGGIDTRERGHDDSNKKDAFADPLGDEQKVLDSWRMAILDFVYAVAQYFSKIKFHGAQSQQEADLESAIQSFERVGALSEGPDKILIRYRGMRLPGEKDSERFDYVATCGEYSVDFSIVKALAARKGITMSHLPGKLKNAFDRFPALEINSLCFFSGKWQPKDMDLMRMALKVAAGYFVARQAGRDLNIRLESSENLPAVIYDDKGDPDPNLTLLAGINGIDAIKMQALVKNLSRLMQQPDTAKTLTRYVSNYDALFAFKNIREKLKRSPIEINNLSHLLTDSGDGLVNVEKNELVRMIAKKYNRSSRMIVQGIDSIYGNDFSSLNSENVALRLRRASRIFDSIKLSPEGGSLEREMLSNLETRLSRVRDDIFENMSADQTAREEGSQGSRLFSDRLSGKIEALVLFFKNRALTKKKIKEIVHRPINFDEQDYEAVARDFGISVAQAKGLLELLKGCFDGSGAFIRSAFEKSIPQMVQYGERIFGFLWHYLKETVKRKDRVAFLNSLQFLIFQMDQSPAALKLLLEDFCSVSSVVNFSDRNGMILANVLLRKYNKELHNDIEITPEEVLLVKEGLSRKAIKAAGDVIDQQTDSFFEKIRSIHREILLSLQGASEEQKMPLRFLLSLERECFIFLALIGRPPGHTVLKSAVNTYGNPDSEIYGQSDLKLASTCQKHLRVAVRGLSRYQDAGDLPLLERVRAREPNFLSVSRDSAYRDSVAKSMQWIDWAVSKIQP